MGVDLPFANVFMDDPNLLDEVGVKGSKGMVHVDQIDMPAPFKNPDYARFHKAWNDQWKNKWKTPPYNSRLFEHPVGSVSFCHEDVLAAERDREGREHESGKDHRALGGTATAL